MDNIGTDTLKKLRILVSAYACNPYLGSEAGVGWSALESISNSHEVFLITGDHNRPGLERAATEGILPANVRIRYISEPHRFCENRLIARVQNWLRYRSYNTRVLSAALEWHNEESFDLCHQVTIATWRIAPQLWKLPIPFVWGPIGGAGYIPGPFRSMLSPKARLFECVRDLSSAMTLRSRSFHDCMRECAVVIAANEETEIFLKPYRANLPLLRLPVVSITRERSKSLRRPSELISKNGPLRLFVGGNMIGSKGTSLALRALAKVKEQGIDFRYTIAGGGPDLENLKRLSEHLGLQNHIHFHPGYSGQDYIAALHSNDIYFLPSFRETMGMTLVEAILAGCYPIVADISAQGEIVRMTGGTALPISNIDDMIKDLSEAVIDCNSRRDQLFFNMEKTRDVLCNYLDSHSYDRKIAKAYAICTGKITQ